MEKKIFFTIEEDIYEKFCLALNLTKEEEAKAIETSLKWYIARILNVNLVYVCESELSCVA